MTAWDVGANAGYYTLLFSRLAGASGRVVAFEPFAANSSNLLDHLSWNRCENVQFVQTAVSDSVGVSGFDVSGLGHSMVHLAHEASQYMVPTVTMDYCIDAVGIAIPDVIKMDIEGAEVAALRGATTVLAANRTTWFVSLHGVEAVAGCGEIFTAAGYRLTDLEGNPLPDKLAGFLGDEVVALPPASASRTTK
jgi:FkbM family methyltransferase